MHPVADVNHVGHPLRKLIPVVIFTILLGAGQFRPCLAEFEWEWCAPYPQGHDLSAITYGQGKFVAVGAYGSIVTSDDGVSWQNRASRTDVSFSCIAYGSGKFIASGASVPSWFATTAYSTDGISWTYSERSVGTAFRSIAYGLNMFVGVNDSGMVFTSGDGVAWTKKYSPPNRRTLAQVAFGNGTFVAVGYDSVIVTSTDGNTWQRVSSMGVKFFQSVAYGNGLFVATPGGDTVLTSSDGTAWSKHPIGFNKEYNSVIFGKDLFLALGMGGIMATSADGITWIDKSVSGPDNPFIIHGPLGDTYTMNLHPAYGGGVYAAVGLSGFIVSSTDGGVWRQRTGGMCKMLRSVTYGNGKFLANASDGYLMTSTDGTTWRDTVVEELADVDYLSWMNNSFVATSQFTRTLTSGGYYVSSDAKKWTRRSAGSRCEYTPITFGNGRYVAVCNGYSISTSVDGTTWAEQAAPAEIKTRFFSSVNYLANKFIAVGDSGAIITSVDGSAWESRVPVTTDDLYAVAYGNGKHVAVGIGGRIVSSTDGAAWRRENSGTPYSLYDVVYAESQFIAVGSNRTILTSPDGSVWTDHSMSFYVDFYSITCGAGQVVIAGNYNDRGMMLRCSIDKLAVVSPGKQGLYTGEFKLSGSKRLFVAVLPDAAEARSCLIDIYNIAGKRVFSHNAEVNGNSVRFEKPPLPSGSYVLTIKTGSGRFTRQLLTAD